MHSFCLFVILEAKGRQNGYSVALVCLVGPYLCVSLILSPHLVLCRCLFIHLPLELRRHANEVLFHLFGWHKEMQLVVAFICLLSR